MTKRESFFNQMLKEEQKSQPSTEAVKTQNCLLNTVPVRVFREKIVELDELCSFCGVDKITSGTWLQIGDDGIPCCWKCYQKA